MTELTGSNMEITAEGIRRVEFRERLRGYNQSDVDEFLERVAGAVERLHEQLREAAAGRPPASLAAVDAEDGPIERVVVRPATLRATPTPAPAPPATGRVPVQSTDDSLRRTLELAQRAADLAVQEARQEGAAIVGAAEARAVAVVADAEDRARLLADEAQTDLRVEVDRLEARSAALQAEVGALVALMDGERTRARTWLAHVTAAVEGRQAGETTPATGDEDAGAATS